MADTETWVEDAVPPPPLLSQRQHTESGCTDRPSPPPLEGNMEDKEKQVGVIFMTVDDCVHDCAVFFNYITGILYCCFFDWCYVDIALL